MRVEIENIEQMRRDAGIVDLELRKQISQLGVGSHVKLTLLGDNDRPRSQTVVVRITSTRDKTYRGKLTETPLSLGESNLREGSLVVFEQKHIHSIPPKNTDSGIARKATE